MKRVAGPDTNVGRLAPTLRRRSLEARGLAVIEETIAIITPMFGGGVFLSQDKDDVSRDPDPVTPIRTASIVGQLRFWWRACHAHTLRTVADLRSAEAELWGAASTDDQPRDGKVSLVLRDSAEGIQTAPVQVYESVQSRRTGKWNPSTRSGCEQIAYAAFPLQAPAGKTQPTRSADLQRVSGAAILRLTCPASRRDELELALDAWLAFGGLGGRTRRGFGAVSSTSRCVDPEDVLKRVAALRGTSGLAGVPSLNGARVAILTRVPQAGQNADDVLGAAIERLRLFRQGRKDRGGLGRNLPSDPKDAKKAGRSLWPEAEQIRALTKNSESRHRTPRVGVAAFPRSVFGMPIIFHFQDGDEPDNSTLVPKNKERLASPLIIRPYVARRDARGQATYGALALVLVEPGRVGMQVVLRHPTPARGAGTGPWPRNREERPLTESRVAWMLTSTTAAVIHPLHELSEHDVLEAFLKWFQQ